MKKLLLLFCLMIACSTIFAQKTYVKVYYDNSYYKLRGNVPNDMNSSYHSQNVEFMDLVNMLAERGYEVEFVISKDNFLMSRKTTGSYNAVRSVELNDDEEVTEVARYNLQGLPVKEHDKGVQIIVYSNYTTKTTIIQ